MTWNRMVEAVLSVIIHISWILNSINIKIWKLGNLKKPWQIKLAESLMNQSETWIAVFENNKLGIIRVENIWEIMIKLVIYQA